MNPNRPTDFVIDTKTRDFLIELSRTTSPETLVRVVGPQHLDRRTIQFSRQTQVLENHKWEKGGTYDLRCRLILAAVVLLFGALAPAFKELSPLVDTPEREAIPRITTPSPSPSPQSPAEIPRELQRILDDLRPWQGIAPRASRTTFEQDSTP